MLTLTRWCWPWPGDVDLDPVMLTLNRWCWPWTGDVDLEPVMLTLTRWCWPWTVDVDLEPVMLTLNRWCWPWTGDVDLDPVMNFTVSDCDKRYWPKNGPWIRLYWPWPSNTEHKASRLQRFHRFILVFIQITRNIGCSADISWPYTTSLVIGVPRSLVIDLMTSISLMNHNKYRSMVQSYMSIV